MLIEFSMSNFRSVGERQVLSLVPATNQKDFQENILENKGHRALNLISLYGANGSGKSNLLKAMGEFFDMVKNSVHRSSTERLNYDPFLLRDTWEVKPTIFEMVFAIEERRYRYGYSYNEKSILTEWLFRKGPGREVNIFQRMGETIDTSSTLKANPKIIDAAIEATRDNSLFLSTMDTLNIEEANDIIGCLGNSMMLDGIDTAFFRRLNSVWGGDIIKNQVTTHLKRLKLGIIGVDAKKLENSGVHTSRQQDFQILATHRFYDQSGKPTDKEVTWDYFERESSGSSKALEISSPVLLLLQTGGILVIDEIEAKMHPLLTLDTINLFLNKETNPHNAQLIFSTHDTNLLSYADFRRDQIYFAEKNSWESTEIYSLSDFVYINEKDGSESKERPDTDKEKRYIEGRYGAVPVLGPLVNLKLAGNG